MNIIRDLFFAGRRFFISAPSFFYFFNDFRYIILSIMISYSYDLRLKNREKKAYGIAMYGQLIRPTDQKHPMYGHVMYGHIGQAPAAAGRAPPQGLLAQNGPDYPNSANTQQTLSHRMFSPVDSALG